MTSRRATTQNLLRLPGPAPGLDGEGEGFQPSPRGALKERSVLVTSKYLFVYLNILSGLYHNCQP